MNKKFVLGLSLVTATVLFISGCASDSSSKGSASDSLPTPATPPPGAPAPATAPAAAPAPAITEEIHNPAPAQQAAAPVATEKYTVKNGDSLWKIARDHKTSVAKLKDLNHLTADVIRAGDELVVPVVKQ